MKRCLVLVALLIASVADAQIGMGGGTTDAPPLVIAFIIICLPLFALTVFAGILSSIGAFWPLEALEYPRRVALRWVALSWLEPSLTSLSVIVIAGLIARSESQPSVLRVNGLWLLLSVLIFAACLLPPLAFQSRDPTVNSGWRTLRLIAVARGLSIAAIPLSLLSNIAALALPVSAIGLGVLIWSFLQLGRAAKSLNATPSSATS